MLKKLDLSQAVKALYTYTASTCGTHVAVLSIVMVKQDLNQDL